jgi:hypothetical protein
MVDIPLLLSHIYMLETLPETNKCQSNEPLLNLG